MHWELSDEQTLFADSIRDWLGSRAGSEHVRSWFEADDQRTFDNLLIEEGWAGVGFDESAGGQGGGLLELALTARELGRVAAPSARWLARAIAVPLLADEPDLATAALDSGELTVLAIRSDRIPQAGAGVELSDGRLTGQIRGVLAGAEAARLIVPVQQSGGSPTLMVVDRDAPGVALQSRALLDRSRSAADISLSGAQARPLRLAIDPREAISSAAGRAAVLVAADALGAAERMLEMTVDYAQQRKQFGRPIAAFQAVKHAAAQMLVTVESSYSIALFAAASVQDDGADARLHAAAAKAQVTQHCAELADTALTVHGAIGYTWEYDLQFFYKRAKLDQVLYGSPEAWNERIADLLPIIPAAS